MRRCLLFLMALVLLPVTALAEALTLYTVSSFAGADASAVAYVERLKAFEEETGVVISDNSASSDETWKTSILYDFAAGNEPDVLFFFAANADSAPILSRVVPISEINAAYPDLHLPENPTLTEADGLVYAIPVRPFWEGLFLYRKDGSYPIDNNLAERSVRPFTTKRKSSLHFGSDEGVEMSAVYHSIISTLKLCGKSVWSFFGEYFRCEVLGLDTYKEYLPALSR